MDEKCKWEGDTLYICDKRSSEIRGNITTAEVRSPFCEWCGADITKPEFKQPCAGSGIEKTALRAYQFSMKHKCEVSFNFNGTVCTFSTIKKDWDS